MHLVVVKTGNHHPIHQTISQTMGPETLAKFINPDEYIKRLAAAQGIDYLNLVKSVRMYNWS